MSRIAFRLNILKRVEAMEEGVTVEFFEENGKLCAR